MSRGVTLLPTMWFFFFQAEDGIRDDLVTGVQTCALPISASHGHKPRCRFERQDLPHGRAIERQIHSRADADLEYPAFRRANHTLAIRTSSLLRIARSQSLGRRTSL